MRKVWIKSKNDFEFYMEWDFGPEYKGVGKPNGYGRMACRIQATNFALAKDADVLIDETVQPHIMIDVQAVKAGKSGDETMWKGNTESVVATYGKQQAT
jgi:hypothetical protein